MYLRLFEVGDHHPHLTSSHWTSHKPYTRTMLRRAVRLLYITVTDPDELQDGDFNDRRSRGRYSFLNPQGVVISADCIEGKYLKTGARKRKNEHEKGGKRND
jgi:hypothetical protein